MFLVEPFITFASALCECGSDTREQLVVVISVVVHHTAYPLATMGRVESFVLFSAVSGVVLTPLAVILVAIFISVLEIHNHHSLVECLYWVADKALLYPKVVFAVAI